MSTRKRTSPRALSPREGTDPQQQAVYEWEEGWYDWSFNTLKLKDCREIAARVCKAYGVTPVRIRGTRTESAGCYCEDGLIILQAAGLRAKYKGNPHYGAKNLASLLHELAHYLACELSPREHQDHGPTFMGFYMHLLIDGGVAPAKALRVSARVAGIRWRTGMGPDRWRKN